MDSSVPISVLAGKAVLTEKGLFVGRNEMSIWNSDSFSAFVLSTQPIIVEALERTFPDCTGELSAEGSNVFKLNPGLAPWDQYCRASLTMQAAPGMRSVIVAWCVLLNLVSVFEPQTQVDPRALLVARFIAKQACKAMFICPIKLEAWLQWRAQHNPFAHEFEQLAHEDKRPSDPFSESYTVVVPWLERFGPFCAFDVMLKMHGDVFLKPGRATVSDGGLHYVYGPNDHEHLILAEDSVRDYRLDLQHRSETLNFRACSRKHLTTLRLLGRPVPQIYSQGVLQ